MDNPAVPERRNSRASSPLTLLTAAALALALASFGAGIWLWQLPTSLDQPDIDEVGWAQYQVPGTVAGRSYTFAGVTSVCISGGDDPVTITAVELLDPVGSIRLAAYSVATNDDRFPAAGEALTVGSLESIGWPGAEPVQVRARCARESSSLVTRPEVLGLELRKDTDTSAGTAGFRIHWRSHWRRGVVTYPYAIVLCEHTEKTCPDLLPE